MNSVITSKNIFIYIGRHLIPPASVSRIYISYFGMGFPHAYNYIMTNRFITKAKKVIIINIFFNIRTTYDRLNSFAKIVKNKLTRKSSVTTDLCLNNLDNYPEYLKIDIIQHNTKYTFSLADMLNLWNKALTKSITFSPIPEYPKNPYTNIPFNKAVFVNSYLKLKKTHYTIPISLELLWRSSLDIDKFELEAYTLLKECAVKNYIEDSSDEVLLYDVINMLSSLGSYINYRTIHPDFYSKKSFIVKHMKPYLMMFLMSQESCNKFKRKLFRHKAINELLSFFALKPTFGRRIVYPILPVNAGVDNEEAVLSDSSDMIDTSGELSDESSDSSDAPVIPDIPDAPV